MASPTNPPQECPCAKLQEMDSFLETLNNPDDQWKEGLDWISGAATSSSCPKKDNCRVRASFHILTGIREACKPYLEPAKAANDSATKIRTSPRNEFQLPSNLEDQFPSLTAPSTKPADLKGPNTTSKTNDNKADKKKKRIRPVMTIAPAPSASGVWGEIAKQPPQAISNANNRLPPSKQPAPSAWGKPQSNVWPAMPQTVSKLQQEPKAVPTPNPTGSVWGQQSLTSKPPEKQTPTKSKPPQTLLSHPSSTNKENIHLTPKKQIRDPQFNSAATLAAFQDVTPASKEQLDRFVEIYCQLVLNGLVPSTVLEFHLLLRMLHVRDSTVLNATASSSETIPALAPLFANPKHCRTFASKALTQLSPQLKAFGISFLQDLIKSQIFREHLPDVTKQLELYTHKMISDGLVPLNNDLFSGSVVLSLPFQAPRDSRHNFKTREEVAMYKNREETRDAFLFQLRSFLNVKGKVLDAVKAKHSMERIQNCFRTVLEGIMGSNLPWFAQFFCELLLQVGLTPVEETDKELISIAGKEKLQVSLQPTRCHLFQDEKPIAHITHLDTETTQTVLFQSRRDTVQEEQLELDIQNTQYNHQFASA
jgi:hypothetical protein